MINIVGVATLLIVCAVSAFIAVTLPLESGVAAVAVGAVGGTSFYLALSALLNASMRKRGCGERLISRKVVDSPATGQGVSAFRDPARRQIIADVLGVLSDPSRQRRGWLVEHDLPDAVELCSMLLDDMDVAEFADGSDDGGMPELHIVLRGMVRMLDAVDLEAPAEELLADPRWRRIGVMASDALRIMEGASPGRPDR